ncbi:MAG: class I SAM-dependent methyltransferase, partial [Gammaproteobacteria bacterium]|nr:class I SAM-dependent methyltransferase [Gammaproteobacteria bacterium]
EDARREAERTGAANIRFECADVANFEFDQMFDTVICIGFLHHLSAREGLELLSRIYRHLRPGGLVHTQDPNVHGVLRHLGRLLLGDRYNSYHTPDERELDPESVRNTFIQAGFGEARVRHMDLSLIPGMQLLPNAPPWIMRVLSLLDRAWCASPVARWGSGFAVDAVR